MSLPEVRSELQPPITTAAPSVEAPGQGAGTVVALPLPSVPRPFYSHRLISLNTGMDWCVGCGASPDPARECLPALPRCDSCGQHPAVLNDHGFKVCSGCMNGGRRW